MLLSSFSSTTTWKMRSPQARSMKRTQKFQNKPGTAENSPDWRKNLRRCAKKRIIISIDCKGRLIDLMNRWKIWTRWRDSPSKERRATSRTIRSLNLHTRAYRVSYSSKRRKMLSSKTRSKPANVTCFPKKTRRFRRNSTNLRSIVRYNSRSTSWKMRSSAIKRSSTAFSIMIWRALN